MKNLIKTVILLIAVSTLAVSCKKDTPLTIDNVAPKLSLRLTGGGTDHTFETQGAGMSPDGQFFYRENTKYDFTITISDTSGLGQLIFNITKSAGVNDFTITGSPVGTTVADPDDHVYSIITERSNPYQSFVMTGSFVTGYEQDEPDIQLFITGRDYRPNTTNLFVNGTIHHQSPVGSFGWHEF